MRYGALTLPFFGGPPAGAHNIATIGNRSFLEKFQN
jgi:hypothetical protein